MGGEGVHMQCLQKHVLQVPASLLCWHHGKVGTPVCLSPLEGPYVCAVCAM
jgi:hypothetical protein